jgi:integrase
LAAWSERWFDAKQGKRPKTRAFYRHVLDRYVLPELGGYRLARIDASLLRKWVAGLEVTGLSPTTVGHAYSVCKQVLDSAVEARYLAASPAIIKGLRSRSRPPSTWPSVDQVLALGEAVPDQWRAMILLAGLGGLRLGELLALRREHVHMLRREVRVATQV